MATAFESLKSYTSFIVANVHDRFFMNVRCFAAAPPETRPYA